MIVCAMDSFRMVNVLMCVNKTTKQWVKFVLVNLSVQVMKYCKQIIVFRGKIQ